MVLIISLVSVSLLGNSFTGTADAKNSEGTIYWQSAQPIAIVESNGDANGAMLRLKNNGPDTVSVLGVVSEGQFSALLPPVSIAPGEETNSYANNALNHKGASGQFGTLLFKNFGFYYATMVEERSTTHLQGTTKPLEVTCTSVCTSNGDDVVGCGTGCGAGMSCCVERQTPMLEPGEPQPDPNTLPMVSACMPRGGSSVSCGEMPYCGSGQFYCANTGACVPIGTVCDVCGVDCGVGKVCCHCTSSCMDVQIIGSCTCPEMP